MVITRQLSLKADSKNPPYASILALASSGFSVPKSVKLADGQKLALNLDGVIISNDVEIARIIAQSTSAADRLLGESIIDFAIIDNAINFIAEAVNKKDFSALLAPDFSAKTSKNDVTAADLAIFSVAHNNSELKAKFSDVIDRVLKEPSLAAAHNFIGLYKVAGAPKSTVAATGGAKEKKKDDGKFVELPAAEQGKVVVRFSKETNGYLHIGDAQGALLNQILQHEFDGQLIMRFDDTNPAKENAHFEHVIKEDLAMLNIIPDRFTHSSDHFEILLTICEKLLKEGKAFVDDTDTETIRKERENKQDSKNRENTVQRNVEMWGEMIRGTYFGRTCVVRIKFNMQSSSEAMRDPTIYRCKPEEHVRTGPKYKVYPTYDFTCPIVDSIEGVTHVTRSYENSDRDDQYVFICDSLGLRKPQILKFPNFLIKSSLEVNKKMAWVVKNRKVNGWDDPRLPTVRGVMRRGLTVEGLKQFIVAQEGSRYVVMMEWDKIWSFNKKVIDPVAPRFTALDASAPLVTIELTDSIRDDVSTVQLHPKNTDVGTKEVHKGKKLLLEQVDAAAVKEGEIVTFVDWGNIKIGKIEKTGAVVTKITATLQLDNTDYEKTTKVTWLGDVKSDAGKSIPVVTAEYDHIISKAIIGNDKDWKKYISFDSVRYTKMTGEPAIKNVKKGDIIQIQRKGFYIVDEPYNGDEKVNGDKEPILLTLIDDRMKLIEEEQLHSTSQMFARIDTEKHSCVRFLVTPDLRNTLRETNRPLWERMGKTWPYPYHGKVRGSLQMKHFTRDEYLSIFTEKSLCHYPGNSVGLKFFLEPVVLSFPSDLLHHHEIIFKKNLEALECSAALIEKSSSLDDDKISNMVNFCYQSLVDSMFQMNKIGYDAKLNEAQLTSRVLIVNNDTDFKNQMDLAGSKPVIVDFTAAWCGPCKMIAPTFDALSNQFLGAVFLKVDIIKCEETCISYGITSMPAYLAFVSGKNLHRLRLPTKEKLEAMVKKYAMQSTDGSLVDGQSDLTVLIDKKQMECLNGSVDTPLDRFIEGNCNLVSDCDEQLIVSLPFNQPVKVHSVLIKGVSDRSPKRVKVFSNLPKTIDFDNASGLEPTQLLEFDESAANGQGQILPLKYPYYLHDVNNIQFFIESNTGGGDVTELVKLTVFGSHRDESNKNPFKMPVINVKDDTDFKNQMDLAGSKPVIVDFTAAWCGPCKMIAPTFDALSNQFLGAVFLKVDVDVCEQTGSTHGVSSMPTFIVFQNGTKMDQMKGANKEGLEAMVKKYATQSTDGSLVDGQSDLTVLIDKKQMECLNGSDDTPLDRFIEGNCNLVSDCDEQLIVSLPFNQPVKVHSVLIKGVSDRSPKRVKVFSNLPKTIDFDNASGLEPTQLLEFDGSAANGQGQILPLKYVKFQNVQNIQFFIENNTGGGDVTELVKLTVFGTPLSAMNMSEFKRVAGKAGDAH